MCRNATIKERAHGDNARTLTLAFPPKDAAEIVEEHIKKGNVVKRLALMELRKDRCI